MTLHLISAAFIFVAAIVPLYLSFRLKNRLKKLSVVLSIFILIHGFYHVFGSLGYYFLANSIFEPISAAMLVAFGMMYLASARNRERRQLSA